MRAPFHLLSWIQGVLLLGASLPVVLYLQHCPTIVSCSGGAEQQLGLCWCLLSSILTLNNDVAAALMLHARPNEWERNIFIILKCQIDFTSSWHYLYILLSPPPLFLFFSNTALISQAVIVSAAPSQARAFERKKKTNMLWVFSYADIISCPSLSQWMC